MSSRRTIAHLLDDRMLAAPDEDAHFAYVNGEWVSETNATMRVVANELGMGLWAAGVRHGDRVAVMSNSRIEWSTADHAALVIGAAVVSIYPTSTSDACRYILEHSGAKVLFIENASHWTVISPHLNELPDLSKVIVIDADGMPDGDWVTFADVMADGKAAMADNPDIISELLDAVQPDDLASLMYTSGTTGVPKGVALKHNMLFTVVEILTNTLNLRRGDTGVIYLPMSHILQRVNVYYGRFAGIVGYFAPSITDFVMACQAANPRSLSGVPRVFEKINARIMAGVEQQPAENQAFFKQALELGRQRVRLMQAGKPVPEAMEAAYQQFDQHIFSGLRASIFGSNIEYVTCGAAPISYELIEFYHAIGLPLLEGYGLTETCSPITLNLPDNHRIGTVGPPLEGSSIKIAEDGEVLLKGPSVFEAYYRNEQATKNSFTEDGWFMSGDIGELDDDGFLRITDRKKFLIITAAGKNIAPAPIEQKLLQHPLLGQVVVHGDKRKHLTALLTLDPDGLAGWAESQGVVGNSAELSQNPTLVATIEAHVAAVNDQLAQYETIKKFHILPHEFSIENGFLTPSMKLKRRVIETEHQAILDSLY